MGATIVAFRSGMDRALYPDRDLVWECLSAFFHRKGSVHRLASIHLEYRFQPGVLADPIRHAKQYACRGGLRAIAEFGIRNVYFTNERGNAEVI